MGETRPPSPRSSQRVAVYGIYESPDRQVLLVRAAPYLTVAGQWFLPGGGLEHGEEPVAGLRREFAEETGLDVGFRQVSNIRLARTRDRLDEYRYYAGVAATIGGIDVKSLTPEELKAI